MAGVRVQYAQLSAWAGTRTPKFEEFWPDVTEPEPQAPQRSFDEWMSALLALG